MTNMSAKSSIVLSMAVPWSLLPKGFHISDKMFQLPPW
jgi:hypothetical protein